MYILSFSHGLGDALGPTTATLLVFATVLYLARSWLPVCHGRRKGRLPYPPGPRCLPVFGYLLSIKKNCHLKLTQLGREFGSVYQIYLGSKRVVVVSDPALIRHAFRQPVFSGRPDTGLTTLLEGYGENNLIFLKLAV